MPERVDFWGIPDELISPAVIVYVVMGLASLVLLYRLFGARVCGGASGDPSGASTSRGFASVGWSATVSSRPGCYRSGIPA